MVENVQNVPPIKNGKRTAYYTAAILVVIALLLFIYWWFWGQFVVYTDDAYVNGNKVIVTPQVRGIVTAIKTDNTQLIEKGTLILSLDKTDASIALKKAQDDLASAVRQVVEMFEKVKELEAALVIKNAEKWKAEQDYNHRTSLIDDSAVSLEDLQHAKAAFEASVASVALTEHQLIAAKAQIENTTYTTHPLVEQAKDKLRAAYIDYVRCDIFAPATGIVAQRATQVGEWVNPGDALLSIIPLDQIWVDANYKETQLKGIRVGQRATLRVDMYGGSVEFNGIVMGQNAGTGSVFSILPPQNATGNWIKIVQRVPVRILLDPLEVQKHPLWLGLSVESRINIRNEEGPVVPPPAIPTALYSTDIFAGQLKGSDELITKVLEENLPQASTASEEI